MTAPPGDPVYGRRLATPFGPLTVCWSRRGGGAGIDRIVLPGLAVPAVARDEPPGGPPPLVADLLARLAALFRGEAVVFPLTGLRLEVCSPFQRRVLLAEYTVPRGAVTTYGLLAAALGAPGAARAVGTALARNPFPLVIPCHRAVRSDGTLGGFQGGLAMKRALLAAEGVAATNGRIDRRLVIRPPAA